MNERQPISPLSPERAIEQKIANLPDEVVEAANMLLIENFSGVYGQFKIRELRELLESVGFNITTIRDKSWVFTLAARYQSEGWEVSVEYPSYDDNFESYISFTDPSKARH